MSGQRHVLAWMSRNPERDVHVPPDNMNKATMTDTKSTKAISHSSPVSIGLMIAVLSAMVWNVTQTSSMRNDIETDMRNRYVTRELFQAEMSALREQIFDLKAEIRKPR